MLRSRCHEKCFSVSLRGQPGEMVSLSSVAAEIVIRETVEKVRLTRNCPPYLGRFRQCDTSSTRGFQLLGKRLVC